jgi:hypothetical protein
MYDFTDIVETLASIHVSQVLTCAWFNCNLPVRAAPSACFHGVPHALVPNFWVTGKISVKKTVASKSLPRSNRRNGSIFGPRRFPTQNVLPASGHKQIQPPRPQWDACRTVNPGASRRTDLLITPKIWIVNAISTINDIIQLKTSKASNPFPLLLSSRAPHSVVHLDSIVSCCHCSLKLIEKPLNLIALHLLIIAPYRIESFEAISFSVSVSQFQFLSFSFTLKNSVNQVNRKHVQSI